jgi:hypothetical protein
VLYAVCDALLYNINLSLAMIPDALEYSGIVIIKRAADAPTTSEPVVFGFAKLQHQRRPLLPTATALGLDEDKVTVNFVTVMWCNVHSSNCFVNKSCNPVS